MEKVWFLRDGMMVERHPDDRRFVRGTVGKDFTFFARVKNRNTRRGINCGRINLIAIYKRIHKNGRVYNQLLVDYDDHYWYLRPTDKKSKQLLNTILRRLEAYPKYKFNLTFNKKTDVRLKSV